MSDLPAEHDDLFADALCRAGGSLDGLLRHTAAAAGHRTAIQVRHSTLPFSELDQAADGFAAALHRLLPAKSRAPRAGALPAAVVGVASALHHAFPIAYYGTIRAGYVCAVINPLQGEEELAYVLDSAGVELLVATADMADRLHRIRLSLPKLRTVVYLDRPGESGGQTVAALAAGSAKRRGAAVPADPDRVAVAQFTSGTTGRPKAVLLTHRNLIYNAAQIAQAHGLGPDSATLNHLPTYHPMHLNSAVYAGATQVLCADPDPAEAVAMAGRCAATHFYSLPVRLARMAADPRLPGWRMPTVRAVLSGGSALAPAAASRLSEGLGIPVVQGYGLAETSPMTHCDRLDRPEPGSVGVPVDGTQCRVVDLDTREPLPTGRPGEVQVRGPQVMAGYLTADGGISSPVDGQGWFDTGDVGQIDDQGRLFLVDRIKDVFKCDNWLVSPAEIERVVNRHPAVVDCMVVDMPHEFRGAVAYALVVVDEPELDPAEVMAFVNGQLPDYQHLHAVELVLEIPRSANGKVRRRDVRTQVHQRHLAATAHPRATEPSPRSETMITIINKLTVTGDVERFEQVLGSISDYMTAQPGFLSHKLYRSRRNPQVFVETAEWADAELHGKAMASEEFRSRVRELAGIATPEPDVFDQIGEHATAAAS